jgi:hypothetical protein
MQETTMVKLTDKQLILLSRALPSVTRPKPSRDDGGKLLVAQHRAGRSIPLRLLIQWAKIIAERRATWPRYELVLSSSSFGEDLVRDVGYSASSARSSSESTWRREATAAPASGGPNLQVMSGIFYLGLGHRVDADEVHAFRWEA